MAQQTLKVSARSFGLLRRPALASSSCLASHVATPRRQYNDSPRRILGYSSLFIQDGISIKELPMVIRRLDAASFPFIGSPHVPGTVQLTDDETEFHTKLQKCLTMEQVLRMLEVPGDQVSARSSALALERLSNLMVTSNNQSDSFIKKAILHELCSTAVRGITAIDNDGLIQLYHSLCEINTSLSDYIGEVSKEIETRIGDQLLSVAELCKLIKIICESPRAPITIASHAWIHLGTRYREIDATTIRDVFMIMLYASEKEQYIWNLLELQLKRCIDELDSKDVAVISRCLVLGNCRNTKILDLFSRWSWLNHHKLNESQMHDILTPFVHFKYSEPPRHAYFLKVLGRYIIHKKGNVSKCLVALTMEYLLTIQMVYQEVFMAIAHDIEVNIDKYQPHELFYTLRPFGQLNYLPPNHQEFFRQAERYLQEKQSEFPANQLIELLASFAYIKRYPINFVPDVLSASFLAKIEALPDERLRANAMLHLLELQEALLVEKGIFLKHKMYPAGERRHSDLRQWHELTASGSYVQRQQRLLYQHIKHILGVQPVSRAFIVMPHLIDCMIFLNDKKQVVDYEDATKRLALILITEADQHRRAGKMALNGKCLMKLRHLEKKGFIPVPVPLTRGGIADGSIRELLSPFIDFSYMHKEEPPLNPLKALQRDELKCVIVREEVEKSEQPDSDDS